ncbi:MAG TPA: hypothetical protein PKB10_04280, partial [Tepidisphaeraceae bacterium]|nr:hypothetical protein [Tepidisphaeraceae bacterium]
MSTLHDIEAAARVMDREIREPDAAAVTEDQARRVIDAVQAFARTHRISEAAIGRATGYPQSAIWQALRMKYPGNWRQIILDLDRWLEDQRKTPPAVSGFVRSVVAERVYALAEMAIHTRRIAAGYGPSGIGKSVAVRALMADKPGAVLVSVGSVAA